MEKNPLVSVIIPNYNHARYLEQRLESVFNQTYQNFEVIFLDDCSTDNSLEIIEKYKDNPHLSQIVVNEENSGSPFKQWNKGFGLAKGEFIWIAESDDYCELNMLEELLDAMSPKNDFVLAFSSYVMFDDDGGKYEPPIHSTQYFEGKDFASKWMSIECVIKNASGVVFKKEALSGVTNDYMAFKQCGDYMFWTQLSSLGKVAMVSKNLTYYRLQNTSVTSKNIASGLFAFEDKRVFDFINSKYHLSWFHKQIVFARKKVIYSSAAFESDAIREKVYECWGISSRSQKIDNVLLWIVDKTRLHLGVLL